MLSYWNKDSTMLSWRSRWMFATTFLAALLIFLVAVLEIGQLIEHYAGSVKMRGAVIERLWVGVAVSGTFLIVSGYAFMFLVSYLFFTHMMPRRRRVLLNVVLFVVAFACFMFFVGDSISPLSIGLLLAGSVSVVISDAVASALTGAGSGIHRKPGSENN